MIISTEFGIETRFDPNRRSWGCLRHLEFSTNRECRKTGQTPAARKEAVTGKASVFYWRARKHKKTNCLLVELI